MTDIILNSHEPLKNLKTDPLVIREKIDKLEQDMFKLPQIAIKTTHQFAHGLYAREIFIPKGTSLTGKIHKYEHLNIISMGDISVLTEHGIKRIKAPCTLVSKPGTKRVGYAHEDTVWTTIHATTETDIKKIEDELIAKTHDEVLLDGFEISELREAICPT